MPSRAAPPTSGVVWRVSLTWEFTQEPPLAARHRGHLQSVSGSQRGSSNQHEHHQGSQRGTDAGRSSVCGGQAEGAVSQGEILAYSKQLSLILAFELRNRVKSNFKLKF